MFKSPGDIAFELGPFSVHWYGILIATGFLAGLYFCLRTAKSKGENPDYFSDLATLLLVFGLIGARLYYVVFNLDYYLQHPLSILMVWQGGLAIHGAIIGGILAGYIYTRIKKLSFLKYCDIAAVGAPLGQAIGRWGNFFNSEAFGTPTDLPWKLFIPIEKRPPGFTEFEFFHPTFLYEAIWNFSIFLLLYFVLRKKLDSVNGALFLSYLALYSLGRFFIEGMRTDSLMLFEGIRAAQFMSLLFTIISVIGLILLLKFSTGGQKSTDKN